MALHQLGIKVTSKSYEILSSNLYSDKISAIIRELSTNAVDSHIAAGKEDLPISITLPTNNHPFFTVQDYGVGLSKDQLLGVFTYFESDKENDNRFTGEKGLGSKSPLSYVNAFDVISVYDGVQYTCRVFKNPDGIPCLDDEVESPQNVDLPNGVRITVPVRSYDDADFADKAQQIYRWFTVKPIISCEIKEPEFLIKTPTYALYKEHGNSLLVMGEVAYPIDLYKVNLDRPVRNVLSSGIVLFCNRGEADTTASRESLEYNEKTIATLNQIFASLRQDAIAHITRKIDSCESYWEACSVYKALSKTILGSFIEEVKPKWQGKVVKECLCLRDYFAYSEYLLEYCSMEKGRRYNSKYRFSKKEANTLHPDRIIFLNDVNRGMYASIEDYVREKSPNGESGCYLLTIKKEESIPKLKEFFKETGIKTTLVSALPKRERKARSVQTRVSGVINKLDTNIGEYQTVSYCWQVQGDYDLSRGGIYVITSRNKPIIFQEPVHPYVVSEMLRLLKNIANRRFTIYGISFNDFHLIKDRSNWVSFKDFMKKILENHAQLSPLVAKSIQYTKVPGYITNNLTKIGTENPMITSYLKLYEECQSASKSKVHSFDALNNQFKAVRIPEVDFDLAQREQELMVKYPLLSHLCSEGFKHAKHYIDLVDAQELRTNVTQN